MTTRNAFVMVVLVAAAPRLAALIVLGDRMVTPRQDQMIFAELAESVATGRGLALDATRYAAKAARWDRPALREWVAEPSWAFGLVQVGTRTSAYEPLYPYTLGAGLKFGLTPWSTARAVNLVFGVAAAAAAFLVGLRLFGRGAALVAGLGVALYPWYLYYGQLAMGEIAHVALLTTLLASYYSLGRGYATAAAFGVAAAAFFLARAVALPVFVILLAYFLLFGKSPRRRMTAGVAVVVFAAALSPWVARNYMVHGAFVVGPTRGGVNLWMRNNPHALALERGELWASPEAIGRTLRRTDLLSYPSFGAAGEVERDRMLTERMSSFLRANPGYFARLCGLRFVSLIKPYGPQVQGTFPKIVVTAAYIAAFGFGVAGFAASWRRGVGRAALPLALVFVFYLVYHALIHGGVRYRLPADVCLLLYAGLGVVAAGAARGKRRGTGGTV